MFLAPHRPFFGVVFGAENRLESISRPKIFSGAGAPPQTPVTHGAAEPAAGRPPTHSPEQPHLLDAWQPQRLHQPGGYGRTVHRLQGVPRRTVGRGRETASSWFAQGASVNFGKRNGLVAIIRQNFAAFAIFCHCAGHRACNGVCCCYCFCCSSCCTAVTAVSLRQKDPPRFRRHFLFLFV